MDKSDKNSRTFISLLDSPEEILLKIQKAKTDSVGSFSIHEETEGIANLATIFSELTGQSKESIASRYQTKGYAVFKKDLGECTVSFLAPIQNRYREIRQDNGGLLQMIKLGRNKAIQKSKEIMERIRNVVGIV
jgi:tryptophanyl-tRNA synthetase